MNTATQNELGTCQLFLIVDHRDQKGQQNHVFSSRLKAKIFVHKRFDKSSSYVFTDKQIEYLEDGEVVGEFLAGEVAVNALFRNRNKKNGHTF